jgi:hypothetical protein
MGLPLCTGAEAADIVLEWNKSHPAGITEKPPLMGGDDPELAERIEAFFEKEENALLRLRNLLSFGGGTTEDILKLLENREYLYLHFPDGYKKPSADVGFLKRVRSEIDFFLKDIRMGQLFLKDAAANKKTDFSELEKNENM